MIRLPRWTAYVALVVITFLVVIAVPRTAEYADRDAAREARRNAQDVEPDVLPGSSGSDLPEPKHPRVVVLGIEEPSR